MIGLSSQLVEHDSIVPLTKKRAAKQEGVGPKRGHHQWDGLVAGICADHAEASAQHSCAQMNGCSSSQQLIAI